MSTNITTLHPGQESIKVIESGTIRQNGYGFLLVFYSNCDLETLVRGHSRSSEPTRINPPPMTSY